MCYHCEVIEVREYLDRNGRSPFGKWFLDLDATAAARVAVSLKRIELGNLANVKSVGGGVHECKLDFGPGYRIYFGRDGDKLVILLAGGSKRRQSNDIANAKARWADYRQRRAKEQP
jgi:putative addiction module killer protein